MIKFKAIVLVFLFLTTTAWAATRTVVASGDWSSGATWQGGTPGNNDAAVFAGPFTVTFSALATVGSFTMSDGVLDISATLTVGGTCTFSGSAVITGTGTVACAAVLIQSSGTVLLVAVSR